MIKNKERLDHGLHNEEVCNYLQLKDFPDWRITTAFYSALQFVKYKIFPFELPGIEGKKTPIEDIDDLLLYQKNNLSKHPDKHQLLADMVAKHCSEISEDYDWLLDMSKNARYVNYQQSKEVANRAQTLMVIIKKFCTKEVK